MEQPDTLHPLDDQPELVIFLQILNGIHFQQEKLGRKIALVASLNSQVFEAVSRRPVTPGSGTASFNAKLVWQCDRYSLKLMKTKNSPIKLDCFEIQPTGARCLIGSVVIPLRSVPVVTLARVKSLQSRWYRLIGIEHERWRRMKPEINLLVMVTTCQYMNQCTIRDDVSTPEISGDEESKISAPNPTRFPSNVQLLEGRGLLQVGCYDKAADLFVFEIELKCAQHLEQLCPGNDSFCLLYELFGEHHVSTAERVKPGSAVFNIKAKIRINLRTSLEALADYFESGFKILISVLLDRGQTPNNPDRIKTGKTIGKATVDFVGFLKSKHLEDFKAVYAANNNTLHMVRNVPFFAAHSNYQMEDKLQEKQIIPSLKYKLSLRYLGNDRPILKDAIETQTDATGTENLTPQFEEKQHTVEQNASKPESSKETAMKQVSNEAVPSAAVCQPSTPQSPREKCVEEQKKVNIDAILMTSEQDLRDIRRTFAFLVRVGMVKFTSSPSPGLWQLALQHPKADTPFTKITLELLPDVAVHEDRIEFGDVTLELLFSALPDRVVDTISSEPSKLTLNGPHGSYALGRLDNESLLVGSRERQPAGVLVMVNEGGENVAIASVSCDLKEVGLNYNCQLAVIQEKVDGCLNAGPSLHGTQLKGFDETIAYKLLEEQKAWMQEQREQFSEQLREKEHKHLQALAQSWKEQQTVTEKRLAERLAHVDALAAALEESHRKTESNVPQDTLRVKQMEQQFRAQLEEIRAKAIRLEQEAETQIETTRRQGKELQQQQIQLSADQQYLVDSNRALRIELEQERARCVQLQQQLEELTVSKQQYKEQWAKQTRKVHQLQQEVSMARTPYFQPSAKDSRISRRKNATGSVCQMSMAGSSAHQGAGDGCSICNCPKDSDD
ncbi:centrosomal protein of 120 kDa-like [Anopheles marshallii]|uniref:centrosomal protein of 120 kDa-like n=1 Tax=Anopheles marshallii TaxID=1521116 RepID=UPI00237C2F22|nr:centrosomal protein of 120 kDa-like [Anopheles marshallii]